MEQRVEQYSDPQKSLTLPNNSQSRIDHLERLVRTLIENQRRTQEQAAAAAGCLDLGSRRDVLRPGTNRIGKENGGSFDITDQTKASDVVNLTTSISISAAYEQARSSDEAHWAVLLNEVRNTTLSSSF